MKFRGRRWFYDGPGEGPMGAVLQINAVEWDAGLERVSLIGWSVDRMCPSD